MSLNHNGLLKSMGPDPRASRTPSRSSFQQWRELLQVQGYPVFSEYGDYLKAAALKHAEHELDVYRHRMKLEGRNLDGRKKLTGWARSKKINHSISGIHVRHGCKNSDPIALGVIVSFVQIDANRFGFDAVLC